MTNPVIIGETERAVRRFTDSVELAAKMGLETKLEADAALAMTEAMNMLARHVDLSDALETARKELWREVLKLLAAIGALILLAVLLV